MMFFQAPLSPAAEVSPMEVPKIGYKVTRNSSSVFIRIHGTLNYPPRAWVFPEPETGPMSVFDSRKNAERWQEIMDTLQSPLLQVRECLYFLSRETDKMWAGNLFLPRSAFPTGTILARAIFCLE